MKDRRWRPWPVTAPTFGVQAGEYGGTVRDRGIRDQTQAGQAADRSMGIEPAYLAAPATYPVRRERNP
jgi:hypothetical protein